MKLVQLFWWALFVLLTHQLSENGGLVETKVRNRVQKWQQRTWKARFGAALRKDWRSAFGPSKAHHRTRYGLSPEEEDFFTSDSVPNAYSNYHYRRLGAARSRNRGAGRRKPDHPDGITHFESSRPKRHTRGRSELADELQDYLDPLDLTMLDDPNAEFNPLPPYELGQQYHPVDEESDGIPFPFLAEASENDESVMRTGVGADKKLKEFKIVFHHRNLNGNGMRPRCGEGKQTINPCCPQAPAERTPILRCGSNYRSVAPPPWKMNRRRVGLWLFVFLFVVIGGEVMSLRIATGPVSPTSESPKAVDTNVTTTGGDLLGKPPNVPDIDPLRWLVSKTGSIFKGK
ncbi:ABC transporter [Anopheles sinensis]|uniref:ABC transporter n=1 Tax=Anopheles sinensis TaxID=74873 RepID=A0A084VM78_ANOSI|nr:ABC transporter [Anopheles sinensis]